MKKILYSSIAVLFAALMVSSCAKVQNEIAKPQEDEILDVTIIAGNPVSESATKTEIVGTTPYWSVGDRIGVSDGESNNQAFDTDIVSPATTAAFSGNLTVGNYYAYYPYTGNGVGEVPKDSGVYGAKVDLPANQNPTATSFDGAADVMVSKPFTVTVENPTISDLQFARLGAIVKIILVDKDGTMVGTQHPSAVSMTSSVSNLVGRVLINMKNQCLGDPYYNGSMTVSANYTAGTKYEIDGTNATYLVVVPQTLAAGSTLTIAASTEDYSIEKEITIPAGGLKLSAGKITTLKINLEAAHITSDSGAALPFDDDMAWANNGASDSGSDIGSTIATESAGLYISGTKAYKGIGGLKLGTSSASGSITTKELNLSGAFSIVVRGAKYNDGDGANLVVKVDGTEVINEAFASVNFINIPAGTYTKKSKVSIGTSVKRGRIYSVEIHSGEYTPDPIINVTSSNPMAVSNANDLHAIEYSISYPTGASISATANVAWIHDFDYSTPGEVCFEVDAQATDAAARSGVITLSYTGADDVTVTVNQAAGPSSGGGPTVVSVTVSDYATAHSWSNDTQYTSMSIDANVTATISGGGNSGKYYTSGNEWRLYQTESASITINAGTKTITSVTITYSVKNTGTLKIESTVIASGAAQTPNASSVTYTVGNTGSATNGQVKITAISVTYE
jgi:hypothetical protein